MRLGLVCWNLGKIAMVMSITILLPIFWAVFSHESTVYPLLLTFFFALVIGICLLLIFRRNRNQTLRQREGLTIYLLGRVGRVHEGRGYWEPLVSLIGSCARART